MNNYENLYARDYRAIADEKCRKYSNRLALIYFIYTLLISLGSMFSFEVYEYQGITIKLDLSSVTTLILSGPFMLALVKITKKVYDSEKEPEVDELFVGFKSFGECFILYLLQSVYIFLWSLLFIIPGLVKAYAYRMAFYIKEENPELSANECITRSKEMMEGYKWKLFCLDISYFGWLLLCVLTLGILTFWVVPKMEVAHYTFYRNISGKGVRNAVETPAEVDEYTIVMEDPIVSE